MGGGGTRRGAAAAILAAALLSACGGGSSEARLEGGDISLDGGSGDAAGGGLPPLALEARSGGSPLSARPGSPITLRFTRALDAASGRGAVRVEDETRGRAPVPVEAEARGRDLVLRARDAQGWRPGSILSVRVAGMPSLRALRAEDGSALPGEAAVRVEVRGRRRTDRSPPSLAGSEPADGAEGADPAAPVLLRFSEPMDARTLTFGSGGPRRDPIRLTADGAEVPFRAFLDRTRTELTILPGTPFPAGASVAVELTDRVRDAAGNPLDEASTRRIGFGTAGGAAPGAGRIVEAFEDRTRLDPLGTTVRWNDPAERGVLSGVVEPLALESGGGEEAAILLDPRGGTLRFPLTVADLGDEARVLKGLQLLAAPGAVHGELLEPRVRLAATPALVPASAEDAELAWRDATADLGSAVPRGADGAISLPFRHPHEWDGASGLLVEVSWRGIAGSVILRAALRSDARTLVGGADPLPSALRLAPVIRMEAVGERPVARSAWMDSGAASPRWMEPRLRPPADTTRVSVEFQGAPPAGDGSGPDVARATAWTPDPGDLEGLRWIRFRVLFAAPLPGDGPAVLDDLLLPFAEGGEAPR